MKNIENKPWINSILIDFVMDKTPISELSKSVKFKLLTIFKNNSDLLSGTKTVMQDKTRNRINRILSMKWNKTDIKSFPTLIERANQSSSLEGSTIDNKWEELAIEEEKLKNIKNEILLATKELEELKMKIDQANNYISQISSTIGDLNSLFLVPVKEIIIEEKEVISQVDKEPIVVKEIIIEPIIQTQWEEDNKAKKNNKHTREVIIESEYIDDLYNMFFDYANARIEDKEIASDLVKDSMIRIRWYMQINGFKTWEKTFADILAIVDRNWKKVYKNDKVSPNDNYNIKKLSNDFIFDNEPNYKLLLSHINNWMQTAFVVLTDNEKKIINMRYVQKLSFDEISKIIWWNLSLPSVTINYAFKKMKNFLFNSWKKKTKTKKPKETPTIVTPKTDTVKKEVNKIDIPLTNDNKKDKPEILIKNNESLKISPILKNWKWVLDNKELDGLYNSIMIYVNKFVKDEDLSKDIAQEVLIKIWDALESGKYQENWSFYSWAMRIAHNYTIDYFRNNKKKWIHIPLSDYIENWKEQHPQDLSIEDAIIKQEVENQLWIAIPKLPIEQREVIKLRIYDWLSFKEIAKMTSVSINTCLWRYRYAHKNLSKILWYTNGRIPKLKHNPEEIKIEADDLIPETDEKKQVLIAKPIIKKAPVNISWDSILNSSDTWSKAINDLPVNHLTSDINEKIENDFSTFNAVLWESINLPIITKKQWEEDTEWTLKQYHEIITNLDRKSLISLRSKVVAKWAIYDTSKVPFVWYINFLDKMEAILNKKIYS